jgi:hypothetical protein
MDPPVPLIEWSLERSQVHEVEYAVSSRRLKMGQSVVLCEGIKSQKPQSPVLPRMDGSKPVVSAIKTRMVIYSLPIDSKIS